MFPYIGTRFWHHHLSRTRNRNLVQPISVVLHRSNDHLDLVPDCRVHKDFEILEYSIPISTD